jgi:hypothetical protein
VEILEHADCRRDEVQTRKRKEHQGYFGGICFQVNQPCLSQRRGTEKIHTSIQATNSPNHHRYLIHDLGDYEKREPCGSVDKEIIVVGIDVPLLNVHGEGRYDAGWIYGLQVDHCVTCSVSLLWLLRDKGR